MTEMVYHSGIGRSNFGRVTHTQKDLNSHFRFSPYHANQAHSQPKTISGDMQTREVTKNKQQQEEAAEKKKEREKRGCSKIRAASVRKRLFIAGLPSHLGQDCST
ncbi:hypothetical protein M9H77_16351 [Catharanthus roseus]|uniref:Uncharacterized protein n=1 Tax=Catharanthus roseus TaxID=4058 RepID=A0ACC0B1J0_CATRO|nr:hypothetical protein M9H77_16351 [Catharanthus roseus]